MYQLKVDWVGPMSDQTWKLKQEGTYEKMLMDNFSNDPLRGHTDLISYDVLQKGH